MSNLNETSKIDSGHYLEVRCEVLPIYFYCPNSSLTVLIYVRCLPCTLKVLHNVAQFKFDYCCYLIIYSTYKEFSQRIFFLNLIHHQPACIFFARGQINTTKNIFRPHTICSHFPFLKYWHLHKTLIQFPPSNYPRSGWKRTFSHRIDIFSFSYLCATRTSPLPPIEQNEKPSRT